MPAPNDPSLYMTRAEFWGMMAGFCAIFLGIHISSSIDFAWFHMFVLIFIVIIQLICVFYFLKHLSKSDSSSPRGSRAPKE